MKEIEFNTDLQRLWFNYYFSNEAWLNGTKSARLAGYKWPTVAGPRNIQRFAEEIKERLSQEVMSQDEALARMSRIARAPQGECLTPAGIDMGKVVEFGLGDLVKKHKRSSSGSISVEFYDADAALKTILRTHDMLNDHITVDLNIRNYPAMAEEVYGDSADQAGDAEEDADSSA